MKMEKTGKPVKFIYPSSIAVHAIPNLEVKAQAGKVKENDYVQSTTMYGINKLYCRILAVTLTATTNNLAMHLTNDLT